MHTISVGSAVWSGLSALLRGAVAPGRLVLASFRAVAGALRGFPERARIRHQIEGLDDRMLRDIGLSRSDLWREDGRRGWPS